MNTTLEINENINEEREEIEKFLGNGIKTFDFAIMNWLGKKIGYAYLLFCCFIYFPLQIVDLFFHDNLIEGAENYSQIDFQDLVRRICVLVVESLPAFFMIMWTFKKNEIIEHSCDIQKKIRTLKKEPIICYNKMLNDITTANSIIGRVYSVATWGIGITATLGSLLVLIFKSDKFTVAIPNSFNNTVTILYTQQLPYYCWIPVNYRKSKLTFIFAVLFVTFPNLTFIGGKQAMDIILLGMTYLIRLHLEILQQAFRTISTRRENTLDLENELRSLVQYHNDIFNYGNFIANYVNLAMFLDITSSSIIFGVLLFTIEESDNTNIDIYMTQIIFLVAWIIRMFGLCYCGQNVVVDNLDNSICESDWITASKSYKNSVKIILIRMQNPFYIRIGKFGPLDLATFTQILKTGYSFLAVLQNRDS